MPQEYKTVSKTTQRNINYISKTTQSTKLFPWPTQEYKTVSKTTQRNINYISKTTQEYKTVFMANTEEYKTILLQAYYTKGLH